ncbi:MAG: Cof-type HAD-IIB family hydrolase [Bacteroidia bacterium]
MLADADPLRPASAFIPPSCVNRLYVSDLDGTLLRNDATLSAYSRSELARLIAAGLPFTIATARSIVSVRSILGDLPLSLPVVCANGAYMADLATGAHLRVFGIPKPLDEALRRHIMDAGFHPFIMSTAGGQDRLYIGEITNEGMEAYHAERVREQDERLHYADDLDAVMAAEVICLNVIERREPLARLEAGIEAAYPGRFAMYLFENWHTPEWYWLSIYDRHATKARAIEALGQAYGYASAQIVVFGDGYNDLSIFEMAGLAVAPANAKPEILARAHEIIDTNETDSVVKYLAKATDRAEMSGTRGGEL